MNFFIRKGATEPSLQLKLVNDGKTDKDDFYDILVRSEITFDLYDIKTNLPIIMDAPCRVAKTKTKFNNETDLCIVYNFKKIDTSVKGIYRGFIKIRYVDGYIADERELILPISEELLINVT